MVCLSQKDSVQSLYNWQFVHSVHLWVQLLSSTHPSSSLEPLIYPVVQLINGTIRVVPTIKYYPLRFHLCQMLIRLTSSTGKFIPVLPFYLEVLSCNNFNKKTAKVRMMQNHVANELCTIALYNFSRCR